MDDSTDTSAADNTMSRHDMSIRNQTRLLIAATLVAGIGKEFLTWTPHERTNAINNALDVAQEMMGRNAVREGGNQV